MKYVRNISGSVYGFINENGKFIRTKWKDINKEVKKLPKECAIELRTEHEMNEDFWDKFAEIDRYEYNNLWASDLQNI